MSSAIRIDAFTQPMQLKVVSCFSIFQLFVLKQAEGCFINVW